MRRASPGRLYELPILIVVLLTGFAGAVAGYKRHGWTGAVLGFILNGSIVPLILVALIGFGFLLGRLDELRRRG